jgi:spermidine synthase
MILLLYVAFVLSGAAGLIYESIWTRYLGLFVGHDAYAQIIVLVIFLGGMSLGAMLISRWSERLSNPLHGYVAVEFLVGCIGLFFHDVFQSVTAWAYHALYPSLAGSGGLTAAKWAIAGSLILPQSILLGATFPLMSAGVLRLGARRPGRTLAMLYFANSLGASIGVLVAGFYLVELAGLPGTLLTASMLNLAVAAVTMSVIVVSRRSESPAKDTPSLVSTIRSTATPKGETRRLELLLLFTSFGTAVASFIYEIDWIRMLALVLGSATHSFELMLSAFILGLALGAWWIRSRADRLKSPLHTLGLVQWIMGTLALATLPLYVLSFEWTATLLATFARTDAGYNGFTLARYGLCLVVMLPATFCAGMTLPLLTQTLMKHGSGERAIGAVYGWNTLGSIIGVIAGGLVLLPVIGLKLMLIAGASLDMAIGVLLLWQARPVTHRRGRLALITSLALGIIVVLIASRTKLEANLLASGVFRNGVILKPKDREVMFYQDGRTATVSVSRLRNSGVISLATNGKVEGSLTPAWYQACDSATVAGPLLHDAATQTLVPMVPLAYTPQARSAAIIGQGTGMSSHLLLADSALRELVTVEIEPQMIAGSRVFYPANRRVFDDPRSRIVIDDAKSYFASTQRQYDLIISEPSNPWVSGVSGLFTTEFYRRIKGYLTQDGVFGQWLQVYELDDQLVLSVLAGIHQNFRSYELYLAPNSDILVVASNRESLPAPDWSVFGSPVLRKDLCNFIPLTPAVLDALHLVGRGELEPLLASMTQPNSDYYPVLDLGAERRRFRQDHALGFQGLSADWYNLLASMTGRRNPPAVDPLPSLPENPRVRARALGALLRSNTSVLRDDSPPIIQQDLFEWRAWQSMESADAPPINWDVWLGQANRAHQLRNTGTAGNADQQFYTRLDRFMERYKAPQPVRDVVQFRRGVASWDFAAAAAAGQRLLPLVESSKPWIPADELRDGLVIARLHLRDVSGARNAMEYLFRFSRRPVTDLRSQLLASFVESAERGRSVALGQ